MIDSKHGERRTPIERILALINAQTNELHRLAGLNGTLQAAPAKPAKRRTGKKR